jgi:hypothetical protein
MPAIYLDPPLSDEQRRHRLYGGDLMTFSAGDSATKLSGLARDLSEAAFAPHDPQVAQESMSPERYVEILAELKPRSSTTHVRRSSSPDCCQSWGATSKPRTSTCRGFVRWRTGNI